MSMAMPGPRSGQYVNSDGCRSMFSVGSRLWAGAACNAMPFISCDPTATWPWRILRATPRHSPPISIHARSRRLRLMARLGRALNLREVAFAKLTPEQIQRHSIDRPCGSRIVSSAFVPHECVGAVEFVPAEICSSVGQCIVNRCPAFTGNMRVLPAKHDQEFAPDLRDSIERVVVQAFTQTALVDVGRVTAGCCEHFWIGC